MSTSFRRLYSTLPKLPPPSSLSARTLSSPLQVRKRRLRKQPTPPGLSASSPLSPSEKDRYLRLKRLGALLKEDNGFREPTEEEWLTELNEKRTRIRGILKRQVHDQETGDSAIIEDVVGQRIYLPNIIFRMMRNHTPPGEPYNPWEATFRVPMSLTKLDIRSYLYSVYGVKCTYIRTDIYFKPFWRGKLKGHPRSMSGKQRKSYKRAVVGLIEPFYYPEALEDMDRKERQAREEWLNKHFHTEDIKNAEAMRRYEAWLGTSWKPFNLVGPRGTILKAVLARRQARERAVNEGAITLLGPTVASPTAG